MLRSAWPQVPDSVQVQMRMFPHYELVAEDFWAEFTPDPGNPKRNVLGGKKRHFLTSAYFFYGTFGHAIQIAVIIGSVLSAQHIICNESWS